jgi:hypothetical protein
VPQAFAPACSAFQKAKKNEKENDMKKIKSIAAAFTLAAAASVAVVPAAEAQTYYYPQQTYSQQQQQVANQNAEIGMGILGLLGGALLMHELDKNHHDSHPRRYVAPRPVHKRYVPRHNSRHHR